MARRSASDSQREIVEAIQKQVRAEQETATELRRQNDLAEKSLIALEREARASAQRRQLAFDTNDKVSGLLPMVQKAFRDIKAINRRLIEAKQEREQTQDILLVLLSGNPKKIEATREDLEAEIAEREINRRKLLRQHQRNLVKLREQAAHHDALSVPLVLQNQIEAEEEAIEALGEKPR